MDDYTANMSKTRFARVCVTINANFRFPKSVPVNLGSRFDAVKADYKWKPEACPKCLIFGHTKKNCDSVLVDALATNAGKSNVQTKTTWCVKQNQPSSECQDSREYAPPAETQGKNEPTVESSNPMEADGGIGTSNRFSLLDLVDEQQMEIEMESGVPCEVSQKNVQSSNEVLSTGVDGQKDISDTATVHCPLVQSEPFNGETEIDERTSASMINNNLNELVVSPTTGSSPIAVSRAHVSNMDDTRKFMKTIDTCLNICSVIAETIVAPRVAPKSPSNGPDGLLVDRGGTQVPQKVAVEKKFDPANPETWPESIRQADKELSLVMSRMDNPEPSKSKSRKPILKVNLVRGHSGAVLRSSSRNKC